MKGPTVYFWDMEKYGEPKSIKEAKAIVAKYGDQQCDPSPVVKEYIDSIISIQGFCEQDYPYGPVVDAGGGAFYQSQAINKIELPNGNWSEYYSAIKAAILDSSIVVFMPEHEIIIKKDDEFCPAAARKKWRELYEEMNPRFPRTEEDFRNFVTKKIMEVLPEGVVLKNMKNLPEVIYDSYDAVLEFDFDGMGLLIGYSVIRDKYNNIYYFHIDIGVLFPRHLDIIQKFNFQFQAIVSCFLIELRGDSTEALYLPRSHAHDYPQEINSLDQIYLCISQLQSNLKVIMEAARSPINFDKLLNSDCSPYKTYVHKKFRFQHALIAARLANNPDFDLLVDKFRSCQYFPYSEDMHELEVTYPAFVRYLREEVTPVV